MILNEDIADVLQDMLDGIMAGHEDGIPDWCFVDEDAVDALRTWAADQDEVPDLINEILTSTFWAEDADVDEEEPIVERLCLPTSLLNRIQEYLYERAMPPAVRDAMEEVVSRSFIVPEHQLAIVPTPAMRTIQHWSDDANGRVPDILITLLRDAGPVMDVDEDGEGRQAMAIPDYVLAVVQHYWEGYVYEHEHA